MNQRCNNPNAPNYAQYGGAGISVCPQWRSFEAFFAHMGERPTPAHSLDRYPNKYGNYEPGNVRWATPAEQAVNRRDNTHYFTLGEKTEHISYWVSVTGICRETLISRRDAGWGDERALTIPASHSNSGRVLSLNGRSLRIMEWQNEPSVQALGITARTIHSRLCRGWTDEQCLTMPLHSQIYKTPRSSTTEAALQSALRVLRIKFRTHEQLYGRPDIFIEPQLCIFVDGDYWHGLPHVATRDIRVTGFLTKQGYTVLRFSETQIKNSLESCVKAVQEYIHHPSTPVAAQPKVAS